MSIEIENLSFRYGSRTALDCVSLRVEPGSVTGLLGSNGAGKSTLFKLLCGLLSPSGGSLRVCGLALPAHLREARRRIGYVAQRFGLYDDLTVEENLRFYAAAYALDGASIATRVGELCDRFELAPRRRDTAGSLSQGWKQRLAFAAALVHRPSVLLLDEITAGLDPRTREYAGQVIQSEAASGATVLFSTHHMDEAERCASLVWLEEGRRVSGGWQRTGA